jgi:sporulation integral membrane protein YtvI
MVRFLHKRLRVPRGISAGIGVSMSFALLAMVLLSLCAFLLRELGRLANVLPDLGDTAKTGFSLIRNWLLQLSAHAPESIRPVLRQNADNLFSDGTALLNRAVQYLLGLAGNLLTHVPDSALTLGTGIISAFMISGKMPKIRSFAKKQLGRPGLQPLVLSVRNLRSALGSWLLAQLKLTGVSAIILFLGLVLLNIPNAIFWALGICLVDAFPVLGTGTVLLPWALFLYLQGDTPRAVGILGIYCIISVLRSVLEPKLVGKQLGLDPLITLICLYAGYKLWGLLGMLFAPLLAVTAMQLIPQKER